MKKHLLFLSCVLLSSITFSQTVGIGIYSKAGIYNAKNQINFIPLVNLESKHFYLKGYKPGAYFYKEPNFNLSIFVDPIMGYHDFYIKKSAFKEGYKNIDNRNTFIGGGIASDFTIDRKVFGRMEVAAGDKGIRGEIKLHQSFPITDRISITPGISFKFFNKKYIEHFLGTDSHDVKQNKNIKHIYKGKDTVSGGINTNIDFAVTEQITTSIFGGAEMYNNIKESPLVKKDYSYYVGIGVRYSF